VRKECEKRWLVSSPFMTFGRETDRAYSLIRGACTESEYTVIYTIPVQCTLYTYTGRSVSQKTIHTAAAAVAAEDNGRDNELITS